MLDVPSPITRRVDSMGFWLCPDASSGADVFYTNATSSRRIRREVPPSVLRLWQAIGDRESCDQFTISARIAVWPLHVPEHPYGRR
jgi:hypothetical protein